MECAPIEAVEDSSAIASGSAREDKVEDSSAVASGSVREEVVDDSSAVASGSAREEVNDISSAVPSFEQRSWTRKWKTLLPLAEAIPLGRRPRRPQTNLGELEEVRGPLRPGFKRLCARVELD